MSYLPGFGQVIIEEDTKKLVSKTGITRLRSGWDGTSATPSPSLL